MAPFAGKQARILVVDDMATNRALVRHVLSVLPYEITEAATGEAALQLLSDLPFDAVLLDVMMPGISGFDVCQKVRTDPDRSLLPIIMLTSLGSPDDVARGMEVGASDFVTKPFNGIELAARVKAAVEHKRLTDRLDDTESALFALARMVEAKDRTTGDHCDRLSHMAVVFGQALGLSFDELEALRRGGVLHDIGKLGIPDAILLKNGPLDEREWSVMRQHPAIGARLCSPLKTMRRTVDIIRSHHEKWNGTGYPDALSNTQIPLLARVFQIVDVYDALSSHRPYKPPFSPDRVQAIIEDEAAKGFWDPELVPIFLTLLRSHPEQLERVTVAERDRSGQIFAEIVKAGVIDWYRPEEVGEPRAVLGR